MATVRYTPDFLLELQRKAELFQQHASAAESTRFVQTWEMQDLPTWANLVENYFAYMDLKLYEHRLSQEQEASCFAWLPFCQ